MIDNNKIKSAAQGYCDATYGTLDTNPFIAEAFRQGANWAINELFKNLWHPASEEPRKDVFIMVETHNDKNMFYYVWNRWQDDFYPSWTDAVLCSRISRWLYIYDLFQKEGCEQ